MLKSISSNNNAGVFFDQKAHHKQKETQLSDTVIVERNKKSSSFILNQKVASVCKYFRYGSINTGDPRTMGTTAQSIKIQPGEIISLRGGTTAGSDKLKVRYSFDGERWADFTPGPLGNINFEEDKNSHVRYRFEDIIGEIRPSTHKMWLELSSDYYNKKYGNHAHILEVTVGEPFDPLPPLSVDLGSVGNADPVAMKDTTTNVEVQFGQEIKISGHGRTAGTKHLAVEYSFNGEKWFAIEPDADGNIVFPGGEITLTKSPMGHSGHHSTEIGGKILAPRSMHLRVKSEYYGRYNIHTLNITVVDKHHCIKKRNDGSTTSVPQVHCSIVNGPINHNYTQYANVDIHINFNNQPGDRLCEIQSQGHHAR